MTAPSLAIRASPEAAANMPAVLSVTTVRWSPCAARLIAPSSSSLKTSGPATLRVPCSGLPALASATARATSAAAIGWTRVAGRRTVFSSALQVSAVSMNSKNWVTRTIEYGAEPDLSMSSCSTLARY